MAKGTCNMTSIIEEEMDLFLFGEVNDFANWEFINESDAEDSDTDSLLSIENGFVYWSSLTPTSPERSEEIVAEDTQREKDLVFYSLRSVLFPDSRVQYYGDETDENEDDEYDDDAYGLDDELVPWNVSGKLGRQRMRKLGKRVFAKMNNSRKSPILHVKPGCVRGKHGLGLKA